MEALFSIAVASLYMLLDALSADRALSLRMNRTHRFLNPTTRRLGLLYVFVRWRPSPAIKMDVPVVYYIPCDNPETAQKLASVIHRFVSDKGNIVDLPNLSSLEKFVSDFYQLTRFDLSRFPIPTNKILEGMG